MVIVVARYNENVEWTKQFSNVIIYNKGVELDGYNNQIMLKNVGREGHTYYKYIYDNYYSLDDHTIFLQGNPFDHSPNLVESINLMDKDADFEYLSERIVLCNISKCHMHDSIPMIEVYEKIFGIKKIDLPFEFGTGAQFIVSKRNILKHPREFYLKIIELLEYDVCPVEGYVIERFHKLIFD
jgi:hypothetical protein